MKVKTSVKMFFVFKFMSISHLVNAFLGSPFPRRPKLIMFSWKERSVYSTVTHLRGQITPFRKTFKLFHRAVSVPNPTLLSCCVFQITSIWEEWKWVECNSVGPAESYSIWIHETRTTCFKLDFSIYNTILLGKQSQFLKFPAFPCQKLLFYFYPFYVEEP